MEKMLLFLLLSIFFAITILGFPSFSFALESNSKSDSSIYDVLKSHGLPMGLFPKGVNNFTLDKSGRFDVYLDQACNSKFENELHYDRKISGNLSYGQIGGLSGISAQDLFLWFHVKGIRVDVPSSGLIYFDVGVVFKQFSFSSFEIPRDCTVVQLTDQIEDGKRRVEILSKKLVGEGLSQRVPGDFARVVL